MATIKIMGVSILMVLLSGCVNSSSMPSLPQDLMQAPCKISEAATNSDDDLVGDVQTAQCVQQLHLNTYRWQAWYKAAAGGK